MFQFSTTHEGQTHCIAGPKASIEVFLKGGLLTRWRRQEGDAVQELIDGFDPYGVETFEQFFKSAKLSPFVCRLKNGRYHFEDKHYETGKMMLGANALHGLFYDASFEVIDQRQDHAKASLVLGFSYLGQQAGYPFNLHLKVSYHLHADGTLQLETEVTNTGKTNCPLADGWHPYFRLDLPVNECQLSLNSRLQVVMDDEIIPTGALHENELFFQGPQTIGNKHFDDCFQLEPNTSHLPQARLKGRAWQLEVFADENYPFLQIYTPDHRSSIALENLSALPDCFNNLGGLQVLSPGESIRFRCSYKAHVLTN